MPPSVRLCTWHSNLNTLTTELARDQKYIVAELIWQVEVRMLVYRQLLSQQKCGQDGHFTCKRHMERIKANSAKDSRRDNSCWRHNQSVYERHA